MIKHLTNVPRVFFENGKEEYSHSSATKLDIGQKVAVGAVFILFATVVVLYVLQFKPFN